MDVVLQLEDTYPEVKIAVLLPELVVKHWWEYFLHNQRVQLLKVMLLLKGKQRIVVVNIPWYLGRNGGTECRPSGQGEDSNGMEQYSEQTMHADSDVGVAAKSGVAG
jgi:hypothetical protein